MKNVRFRTDLSLQCENDFLPRCANARHRPYIRVTECLSLGKLGGTIRLCQDYLLLENGLSVNNTPVRILFARFSEKFFIS